MIDIRHQYMSDKLSWYRTRHLFDAYVEVYSCDDIMQALEWAHTHGRRAMFLGNGSNILYTASKVRTVIIHNRIAETITPLGNSQYEISSSTSVMKVLKYCLSQSLDSFYYLSSVPATIGGALAMNAGRGRDKQLSIWDYVYSITVLEKDGLRTYKRDELAYGFRHTPFTGMQDRFIVSAVFTFPDVRITGNPIEDRVQWSVACQDSKKPNCGSVFSHCNYRVMWMLQYASRAGMRVKGCYYSPKTTNWIICTSKNHKGIVWLIRLAQFLHIPCTTKAEIELVCVD
jgi:UDP-N-acetylmuramate dehydrogenase